MSLKRYAIIAAVSYHNSNNNQHNSTPTIPTVIAATTTATTSSLAPLQLSPQSSIITSKSSLFSSTSGYGIAYGSGSSNAHYNSNYNNYNNNNYNGSSSLPGYYGGLSLFHQQNIRSGSNGGSNGNNGGTYPNSINSNVNLLLGGAMLSLVTTILCVVCYCCHRSIRKRTEAAYRQQRQWLESDPNMEIYSVEQCYETSGLFIGDSTDGLATAPALHHEPPPSYDAVVLMQEQQLLYQQQQQQQQLQQQQFLQQQRSSPPPGYRSTLDVTAIVAAAATTTSSTQQPTLYVSSGHVSYLNNQHSQLNNNNNNSCINSCDNLNNYANANVAPINSNDLPMLSAGAVSASSTTPRYTNQINPMLSMKKVWNAQSCCSLQRAEVENMWNAAAAAVAARASHAENTQHSMTNLLARKSLPSTTAAVAASTTTLTAPTGGTLSPPTASGRRFGRRYFKPNYYRRGCPLCGKFRYDVDDGSLSISIESNLDQAMSMLQNNTNNNSSNNNNKKNINSGHGYKDLTQVATTKTSPDSNGEVFERVEAVTIETQQQVVNDNNNNVSTNNIAVITPPYAEDEDECSCTTSSTSAIEDRKRDDDDDDDDDNDNNGNISLFTGSCDGVECFAGAPELKVFYQAADDADAASCSKGSRGNSSQALNDKSSIVDSVKSVTPLADVQETQAAAANAAQASVVVTIPTTPTATTSTATAPATTQNDNFELVDLDSINENGIVRVDMSKIIDRTGLPTYEAALKLDSSGYV